MFSIRQNFLQKSSRLPKKRNLLGMDTVYKAQPFVEVVGKNENTLGLDVISKAQPFLAASNNIRKIFPFTLTGNNHPDVQMWQYLGGSASSTTIAAMNTFCNSIDSAGLRNKIYRLNLFCGNNLSSCLIPLYSSTSWTSPAYGYSQDINYNFVSGDYLEGGVGAGLTSSGADVTQISSGSKYLDLGIKPNEIDTLGLVPDNMHLSASVSCTPISSAMTSVFYNTFSYSDTYTLAIQLLGGYASLRGSIGSQGVNSQITPLSSGTILPLNFYIVSRTSTTDNRNYQNGSQIGSTGSTQATTVMSNPTTQFLLYRQSAGYYGNMRITNYSIGLGLNSAEASTYSSIIATFNSALNRS